MKIEIYYKKNHPADDRCGGEWSVHYAIKVVEFESEGKKK